MQIQTEQLLEQIDNFAGICRPGFLTPGSDGMFHCEVLVKESCGSSNWYNVVRTCKNNKWLLEENETLHYWIDPAPETKAALLSFLQQKKEEEISDEQAANTYADGYKERSPGLVDSLVQMVRLIYLDSARTVRCQLLAKDKEKDELMREMWAAIVTLKMYAPIEDCEQANKLLARYNSLNSPNTITE